jgi:hypothetical protein
LISEATVPAAGPSAGVQLTEVVGGADGGLHPQPATIRPGVSSAAIRRESRMAPSLRTLPSRPAIVQDDGPTLNRPPLACRELLLAVHAL